MLACDNKCDIGFVNLRQSKSVSKPFKTSWQLILFLFHKLAFILLFQ